MNRFNQRQGFLVSAIVHLMILMSLANRPLSRSQPPEPAREETAKRPTVFLPPAEVLRRLAPPAPKRNVAPPPTVPAQPPQQNAKDRISIGAPSEQRSREPLMLRKEDDLTAVAKGRPNAVPSAPPAVASAPAVTGVTGGVPEAPGRPGPLFLPGLNGSAPGQEGNRARPGAAGPSIANSLRNLDRRLQETGQQGLATGTGQQMGPLFFDPEGADFTAWINHFKNEVYRNWVVPQPALLGFRGHVDLEFTVERDGTLTNLRMLKSSGTAALDRAAQNALVGSRLLPLPADYGPPRASMQVTFFYNQGPQGS